VSLSTYDNKKTNFTEKKKKMIILSRRNGKEREKKIPVVTLIFLACVIRFVASHIVHRKKKGVYEKREKDCNNYHQKQKNRLSFLFL
jgi:hypothetical protein